MKKNETYSLWIVNLACDKTKYRMSIYERWENVPVLKNGDFVLFHAEKPPIFLGDTLTARCLRAHVRISTLQKRRLTLMLVVEVEKDRTEYVIANFRDRHGLLLERLGPEWKKTSQGWLAEEFAVSGCFHLHCKSPYHISVFENKELTLQSPEDHLKYIEARQIFEDRVEETLKTFQHTDLFFGKES